MRLTVSNSSGETRIAAPVGLARTQAGPPALPMHMSHLMATLGGSAPLGLFFARQALSGSPGPGPTPL